LSPALQSGQTVICDRFLLANVVYQGSAGGLDVDTLWSVGIVFLEAQAQGIPVIAGASGGTGDAMRDGVTGLRIDSQDSENPVYLTEAIDRLVSNPEIRRTMGVFGRKFVTENFDWNLISEQARKLLGASNGGDKC
jgi:phosphatidylinositol alpha-1,6-mannosyltransferase